MAKRKLFVIAMAWGLTNNLLISEEKSQPESWKPIPIPLEAGEAGKQQPNDAWGCGPCSASKYINFIREKSGHNLVTFAEVKGNEEGDISELCPHFDIPSQLTQSEAWDKLCETNLMLAGVAPILEQMRPTLKKFGAEKIGPSPWMLAEYMNEFIPQHGVAFKVQDLAGDSAKIISELESGNPVLVVIKVAQASLPKFVQVLGVRGELPLLHYVLLNGYDEKNKMFYYVDTDNKQATISFDEFNKAWNWSVKDDGVIKDFLTEHQMRGGLAIISEKKMESSADNG